MLFLLGEESPTIPSNAPWWMAGAIAVIGVGYAAVKLFYFFWDRRQESVAKRKSSDLTADTEARREAAQEAWVVVDRLQEMVEKLNARIAKMEEDHRSQIETARARTDQCEQEHAQTKQRLGEVMGLLGAVAAWAKRKGFPIDLPAWAQGSNQHTPLPEGE